EECEPHRLLGECHRTAGGADTACVDLATIESRLDLVDREGRSTDDLTRDGGVLESENDRLLHRAVGEEGLPGEEQPQTDADDENGDDRRPAGGILVFEWQHGSLSLRQTGMLRRHSRVRQANHSEVHLTKFAYFCGHEQYQPEELVRHAVLAEEAGFDM